MLSPLSIHGRRQGLDGKTLDISSAPFYGGAQETILQRGFQLNGDPSGGTNGTSPFPGFSEEGMGIRTYPNGTKVLLCGGGLGKSAQSARKEGGCPRGPSCTLPPPNRFLKGKPLGTDQYWADSVCGRCGPPRFFNYKGWLAWMNWKVCPMGAYFDPGTFLGSWETREGLRGVK